MKNTHVNIPVFIPHLGCPNMCVFCNQRAISGVSSFIPDKAVSDIETVLSTVKEGTDCEIAFFGGSFTGIDRGLMISLLDIAQKYINAGKVSGIRMSTRPDYIDEEIISILSRYTVSAVELGIQTFSERVLAASKRGHTPSQSRNAVKMLIKNGFSVVGQMMIGLPESTCEDEVNCAREIVSLGAVAARIYPTLVFKGTELYSMTLDERYIPLSLDEAVARSADVYRVFMKNGVECLRIGLCESENLHSMNTFYAGPNHPAIGELVYSRIYLDIITEKLAALSILPRGEINIEVPRGDISAVTGQKRCNIATLKALYPDLSINFIQNQALSRFDIVLQYNTDFLFGGSPDCT